MLLVFEFPNNPPLPVDAVVFDCPNIPVPVPVVGVALAPNPPNALVPYKTIHYMIFLSLKR